MSENDVTRSIILEILYYHEQENPGSFGLDRKEMIPLLKLPLNVIDRNVLYLEDKRLIKLEKYLGALWGFARITSYGIDVVEQKEKYQDQFPFIIQIQNIQGSVYGNVVQADNSEVYLTQQVLNEISMLRELVVQSDIIDSFRPVLNLHFDTIEDELKKNKLDKAIIRQSISVIKKYDSNSVPLILDRIAKIILKQIGLA